jgi:hypothetical protein
VISRLAGAIGNLESGSLPDEGARHRLGYVPVKREAVDARPRT